MSQQATGSQPSTAPQEQSASSQEADRGWRRRVPSWSRVEIMDLIQVWGVASNIHDLSRRWRNAAVYGRITASLATKGHMGTQEQGLLDPDSPLMDPLDSSLQQVQPG